MIIHRSSRIENALTINLNSKMIPQKLNGANKTTAQALNETQKRFIQWANSWLSYEFVVDQDNEAAFNLLWAYFAGGEMPDSFSRDKGWLLFGPAGTGKTDLLRIFRRGFNKGAKGFSMKEVWRVAHGS